MTRITRKSRKVNRQNKAKLPKKTRSVIAGDHRKPAKHTPQGRYVIRKDSLDRQYAIDKLTGRRVSVYKTQKAQKERKPRKLIPRHIPPKIRKPIKQTSKRRSEAAKRGWETRRKRAGIPKKRSEAAKKGWETRRKRAGIPIILTPITPPVPVSALPEMIQLYEPMADRMARFPRVKRAAEYAFAKGQQEEWERRALMLEGTPPPSPTGKAYLRMLIEQRIRDAADIDRVVDMLYEEFDHEFSLRELYEIHFSPEAV